VVVEGSDVLVAVLVVPYGLGELLLGGSGIGVLMEIAFWMACLITADNVVKSKSIGSIENGC
jgi:hypothetical protein